jgi:NAD(P)H-dependent FMN reductase
MNIIAFAASSSRASINKQLVEYAARLLGQHSVEVLDINDYETGIYSIDKEKESGIPAVIETFNAKVQAADAVIISFAEHNGSYTAAYKNIFDWCSRINPKVYKDKKVVVLATSPGGNGAKTIHGLAIDSMPHFGAEVVGQFSLPSFSDNFDSEKGEISDADLDASFKHALSKLS